MLPINIPSKPNILIVGYRKFSQLIHSVIPEFESQAQIKIVDYVFEQDVDIEAVVARNNADLVVSAGANAAYLQATLSIPVISIEILEADIIAAVLKAKLLSRKIVSITFGQQQSNSIWSLLAAALDIEICEKHYLTPVEARETFYLAVNEGFELVIGGSFICELAERHSLKSIFLYSPRACRQLMQQALQSARAWQQAALAESFYSALFEVPDSPVIVVNHQGQLLQISQSAKSCLALTDETTPRFVQFLERDFGALQECNEKALNFNGIDWMVSCSRVCLRDFVVVRLFRFRAELNSVKSSAPNDGAATASKNNEFIYVSPLMDAVQRLIETYAKTQGTVLINGATGTGKELVARQIHHHSRYADGEFVAINCGAIPEELFESEMFGYVDGAFTSSRRGGRKGLLETAHNGVFLLDEVSEMPLSQQAKLLRVMQEKSLRPLGSNKEIHIDVKFVAASNRDLLACVKEGKFREDLYYRINVFSINLPTLSSRGNDILALAEYFAKKLSAFYQDNLNIPDFIKLLEKHLLGYFWPGNVRELENIIERLVVAYSSFQSSKEFLNGLPFIVPEWFSRAASVSVDDGSMIGSIKEQELRLIQDTLQSFGGDKSKAAKDLGISTTTLWRRLKE